MRQLILYSVLLAWGQALFAQYTLQLTQPQVLTVATRDFWNCTVINTASATPTVYLHGTISETKDGKIYEINSANFALPAGTTIFNTQNYAVLAPEKVLFRSNLYEEYLLRTNGLPRGEYRFCIELVDAGQLVVLATSCVDVVVAVSTPPATILPTIGDSICDPNPFFIWAPPQPPLGGFDVSYTLFVHEVQGQQTPAASVRNNPAWYSASNIGSPVFQYGLEGRPFTAGRMYAWYVVAFEGKQEASRSDISYFYWKNCPENNSSGNTSNQDPILTNKAKKGVQYHQMPLFDQPIPVTVTEKNLNISYIATAKGKTVLARLEDENGKVIITRELQVGAGYNFFSLQPSEWKMINTKHHVLTLMNENGERQSLYFWYRPKS